MSSISYQNPFQLQKPYSKPIVKQSVKQDVLASQPAAKSNSRSFGALKMARFMADSSSVSSNVELSSDTFQSASRSYEQPMGNFDNSMTTAGQGITTSVRIKQSQLQDTQSGLLQSLSSPARKRDSVPLASEEWLPDAPPYYDDMAIYQSPQTNPWLQVKEKLMDIFFEPVPEQVASTLVVPVNVQPPAAKAQQERPIGIAQLTRVTFSSAATKSPERSPLERLKKTTQHSY